MTHTSGTVAVVLLAALAAVAADAPRLDYPKTRKGEQTDDYHGTKVADPYRWLEDDVRESADVANWVAAENKVTDAYLETIPQRAALRQRLTELWNYEKYSAPFKAGGRYFFTKNDGLQNQSVLYTQDTLEGEPRLLIDPNQWSKDGTVALAGLAFSEDGKYLAYGVSDAGSDWSGWKVMHVPTRQVLGDDIRWVKFGGASWTHDDRGFFYSRYPEPAPGQKFQGLPLNQKIYYHHTQYPGGLRQKTLRQVLEGKFPERALEHAVRGMVMHNRLGARLMSHLKVYAGPTHPHEAQKPVPWTGPEALLKKQPAEAQ